MCKLVNMKANGRNIQVANIKKEYIENIIKSISLCGEIDKIILFGSALEERCTDESDVDIAIFGKQPKNKMYRMKSYNRFVDSIVSYGALQDYDLLYFDSNQNNKDAILDDIYRGEVLYERVLE